MYPRVTEKEAEAWRSSPAARRRGPGDRIFQRSSSQPTRAPLGPRCSQLETWRGERTPGGPLRMPRRALRGFPGSQPLPRRFLHPEGPPRARPEPLHPRAGAAAVPAALPAAGRSLALRRSHPAAASPDHSAPPTRRAQGRSAGRGERLRTGLRAPGAPSHGGTGWARAPGGCYLLRSSPGLGVPPRRSTSGAVG